MGILTRIIVSIAVTLQCSLLLSQSTGYAESRIGVVFYDSQLAPGDVLADYQGWGSKLDLLYLHKLEIGRRWSPILGLGYTNLYYWNVFLLDTSPAVLEPPYSIDLLGGPVTSHYLKILYGIESNIGKTPLSASISAAHYLLLHKDLQGRNQRRMFMNIDLGLVYAISDKVSLTVSSPFTIHPIQSSQRTRVLNTPGGNINPRFERFVEMNGLLFGIRIKL